MMSPHFAGRVAPVESAMRGSFLGVSPRHGRAELARAMLESIAFEYRQYADIARGMTAQWSIQEIIGTGGGSRMGVWNQIKADVLEIPYRPLAGVESGTRGAALVAIASLGHDLPELPASDYGVAATPNPADLSAYCAAYDRYRGWTDDLAHGYRQRSTPFE
jgi:sugar (pentulose or hexulose) kinase